MASSNAVRAGNAYIELSLRDKGVRTGLAKWEDNFAKLGGRMKAIGAVGAAVSGALALPFLGAIKAASNAQETMSKFSVVFGEQTRAMKAWGDNFAASIGRSKFEIAGFLASFQDLLVPMGVTATAAGDMSKTLSTLAIDLASFNNLSDADVVRDLQAALTGSGEVMKKYGVIVSEAAVKQQLLNMGLDPKHATEAEKAQARLNIILAGTTAAQGDAARTAGGFANQMKALQAKLSDAAVEIGNALLPMATELITQMNGAASAAANWISQNSGLVSGLGITVGAAAAVSAGVYALGATFGGVVTAIRAVQGALTLLAAHPIVAAVLAITATVGFLVSEFYRAHDAVTVFDDALQKLDGKRSIGDPDELASLVTRFEQLAKKTKLSAKEQDEARKIMSDLRTEYGALATFLGPDGAPINVEKIQAQLQAARGGRSTLVQSSGIAQAEAAMNTRQLEGADAAELQSRADAIAKMREELERTKRIIAEASPLQSALTPAAAAPVIDKAIAERSASEAQRIEDEIARARINAIADVAERERKSVELEHSIRLRQLTEEGILTAEMTRHLDELKNVQLASVSGGGGGLLGNLASWAGEALGEAAAGIGGWLANLPETIANLNAGMEHAQSSTMSSAGTFSAHAAMLALGGGMDAELLTQAEEQTALLRQINKKDGVLRGI
jgi:hypothetical protein